MAKIRPHYVYESVRFYLYHKYDSKYHTWEAGVNILWKDDWLRKAQRKKGTHDYIFFKYNHKKFK